MDKTTEAATKAWTEAAALVRRRIRVMRMVGTPRPGVAEALEEVALQMDARAARQGEPSTTPLD